MNTKMVYFRSDIENYLVSNSDVNARIYENFDDMKSCENFVDEECKSIYDYTDGLFALNNCKCYVIEGKIFADGVQGINVIFVDYNKDNIPRAVFVESGFCKIADKICEMVNKSIRYLQR